MAFVTKTWKDRLVEYAGRRKLKNVATGEEVLMDVSRSEGTVNQAGDAFSAANMNNLEQRIKTEFDSVNSSLANGQITFSVVDGEPYVQVGADAARPFKSGYSNAKVVASTDSTSQQTVSVSSDTYGEDFIVLLEIFAYNSYFSKSISVSGDITYETLMDGHNLYTYAVRPYFYVLKVKGKGSLTITYQTYDGNIHAGRVMILY